MYGVSLIPQNNLAILMIINVSCCFAVFGGCELGNRAVATVCLKAACWGADCLCAVVCGLRQNGGEGEGGEKDTALFRVSGHGWRLCDGGRTESPEKRAIRARKTFYSNTNSDEPMRLPSVKMFRR